MISTATETQGTNPQSPWRWQMRQDRHMRLAGAALAVVGFSLLQAQWVAATVPPPKFWSTARCERVLPQEHPAMRQVICVGAGGPADCRWTSGRVRLYSKLRVYAWYHQRYVRADQTVEPGVVRSFTLATRARTGFDRVYHHYGDQYIGQPADYFVADAKDIATHTTPARFHS